MEPGTVSDRLPSMSPEPLGEIIRGTVERLLDAQQSRELDCTAADLLRAAMGTDSEHHRPKGNLMKISVIGTGLIGAQVVGDLTAAGHEASGYSRSTGVDLLTGDGLDDALRGAQVAVNLTNSPTFDDDSLDFFRTSVTNLLAAAQAAGVGHLVTLSIVGVDQVPDMAYYRAKTLQENLVEAGPIPYSIVRATQFMEFIAPTMESTTDGEVVRLPATPIQPISSAEVAAAVAEVAEGDPLHGIRNIAGPDVFTLDELGRITLEAKGNHRHVVTDPTAGLFAVVKGDVLTAPEGARLSSTHYRDWLRSH